MESFFSELKDAPIWSDVITMGRNEFLCREGEVNDQLFWILEGCLKVYIYQEEQEKVIRFGYQNNIITPLDSFIHGSPTQFYISTLRKTIFVRTTKSDFYSWLEEKPLHREGWIHLMEKLIEQQLEREVDLLTDSPSERLKRVMKRSPQLFQEVPHKYIASYLRMTPETLSRILNS